MTNETKERLTEMVIFATILVIAILVSGTLAEEIGKLIDSWRR